MTPFETLLEEMAFAWPRRLRLDALELLVGDGQQHIVVLTLYLLSSSVFFHVVVI